MPKLVKQLVDRPAAVRPKSQRSQSQLAAPGDLRFQLSRPELDALPNRQLAARPHQGLPGFRLDPPRQQNLDIARQMLRLRRPRRWLRMNPNPVAKQPRRNHPGVIKDQQLIAPQQVRESREKLVANLASVTSQGQQTRSVPVGQGPLGDLLGRKAIVEFV